MDDTKRLLEEIKAAQLPVSALVEDGRAADVIAIGAVAPAKEYILGIKDRERRQALICKNLSLFETDD